MWLNRRTFYLRLSCQRRCGRIPQHHVLNKIIRRLLISTNVSCTFEPPALSCLDGASYLNNTSRAAASGAKSAVKQILLKYNTLKDTYLFILVAFKTAGLWGTGHTFDCNPDPTSAFDPSSILRYGPGPACDSVPNRFYSYPVRNSRPHPTFNPNFATSHNPT
ncbi:hypothetical protein EVAR_72543_1 [Eumeta japonica]|uniref:Uncharacterized protein n=1 Tax=Eumeta variegata TaxID=151549 RepID=A0A4C1T4D7_EUMVA|nr:hypothetical protein EVAR_72543_1 [Eumeta japonica]